MIYVYKHPKKEEYIEQVQGMNDVHEYTDKDGLKWERVWTTPFANIPDTINPVSQKSWLDVTARRKGTVGDLIDASAELSEKRKDIYGGIDPVKEKYDRDYSAKRCGRKNIDLSKQKETLGD